MSAFDITTKLFPHVIDHDGNTVDPTSFANKYIALYFSAHWCGPCRNFTPRLADRYKKLVEEEGANLEIIFISADEDDEQAMEYFKTMPWKMLNFEKRELETELSRTFEVRGIPSLILLDTDGSLITNEGREVLMNTTPAKAKDYAAEKAEKERLRALEMAALKANFKAADFFGTKKVVDHDGNPISADHLKDKVVGIYFSAHWCPPCRGFTPKLAEKYQAFMADNKPFEIIFVSSDRDAHSAKEYFADMPWKLLDFEDRETKATLAELFEVSGIPTLVVVNADGSFHDEGREAIMKAETFEIFANYLEEKKIADAKLAAEIASYPDTIIVPEHEHPLTKMPSVYRGQYGCDACGVGGSGWVYHCDECGFDMHPACVMKSFKKDE
jgi:nucleoredoxin